MIANAAPIIMVVFERIIFIVYLPTQKVTQTLKSLRSNSLNLKLITPYYAEYIKSFSTTDV
jgi:hypothetical protein